MLLALWILVAFGGERDVRRAPERPASESRRPSTPVRRPEADRAPVRAPERAPAQRPSYERPDAPRPAPAGRPPGVDRPGEGGPRPYEATRPPTTAPRSPSAPVRAPAPGSRPTGVPQRAPGLSPAGSPRPTALPRSSAATHRTPAQIQQRQAPAGLTRPYEGLAHRAIRSGDATLDRPPAGQTCAPEGQAAPNVRSTYHNYYGGYYVHPYYRYRVATTQVVWLGFLAYPWDPWWYPGFRRGWAWVPGHWQGRYWVPGHWEPVRAVPVGYRWVPGYWQQDLYVEGYYRVEEREEWRWIDGQYLEDGTFVPGTWVPVEPGPDGYTWEPGYFEGESWVDGFWRPTFRAGFTWVSAFYQADGTRSNGYWLPLEEQAGQVWIPGWFDGQGWVEGYWLAEAEVAAEPVDRWQPPTPGQPLPAVDQEPLPLALPVGP